MIDRLIARFIAWFSRKWAEAQINDLDGGHQ